MARNCTSGGNVLDCAHAEEVNSTTADHSSALVLKTIGITIAVIFAVAMVAIGLIMRRRKRLTSRRSRHTDVLNNNIIQGRGTILNDLNVDKVTKYLSKNSTIERAVNGTVANKGTQTRSSLTNKCNIFNGSWDRKCTIKRSGGTWTHPDSDVKVNFPRQSFKYNDIVQVEIHGSTFTDIPQIRSKFDIPEEDHIVAPVAEFTLSIAHKLSEYAVVEIPHSMTSNTQYLKVQWFSSSNGSPGKVALSDVPPKEQDPNSGDMFYEVGDHHVRIYTTHFSGFICTVCNKYRNITICATVFGAYEFVKKSEWNVNIRAYLSDDNARLKDFKKVMDRNEFNRKLKRLDQKALPFGVQLNSESAISLTFDFLDDGDEENWDHKYIKDNRDSGILHNVTQTIKVGEITRCCPQAGVTMIAMDWCLRNKTGCLPDSVFRGLLQAKATSPIAVSEASEEQKSSEAFNITFTMERTEKGENALMYENRDSTDPHEKITRCLVEELTVDQCFELGRNLGMGTPEINIIHESYKDPPKELRYQNFSCF